MATTVEKYDDTPVQDDEVWNILASGYAAALSDDPTLRDNTLIQLCKDISRVTDDYYGLFLGRLDGELRGFFLLTRPNAGPPSISPWCSTPYTAMFHNKGGPELMGALLGALKAAVRKTGAASFMAINTEGWDDDAWMRGFKEAGTPKREGSLFTFDVS